ncbi:GNAT family N-acetyltransferase [Mobilicoccus pelagius]|uniref:Putative acetyltransferase n=1 Tax=Mobilicoccus pelagius NBRC 104925 TaxID=1089455 RepID=H5USF4_9MICO|nr:GNAT family protein [Mobilicoccus pelagius]GAB48662.1 putative acetyltransferase [Mobilicoccus pelagius NBRC 104925]
MLTARSDPWLTRGLGRAEAHGVRMRPLERRHADSWGAAMRANYQRMSPWWSLNEGEMVRTTDRIAFMSHFVEWERRRRASVGICMVFVGPDESVVGEVQVWHVRHGGRTCEIGLWLAPDQPPGVTRGAGGCLGQMLDRMFEVLDLGRVDAPVAAANPLPRAFLDIGGFCLDARIPQWRELHGELVDYDLFGLTPERWQERRPVTWRVLGPWGSVDV